MSHKAGEIIIESLLEVPNLTSEQRVSLMALAARYEEKGELSSGERMALAWLVYKLAK